MEFIKNNSKNILIGILLILFIISCFIIFKLQSNKEDISLKTIKGTVIITDKSYVMIESNKENYLIENIKGSYNIGDEVLFTYKSNEINNTENPKKIKINDEELISKKEEEKPTNNENNNQKPNNENNIINNQTKPNTNNNVTNNNQNNNNISASADETVMNYVTNLQNDFNASSLKDSVKSSFITFVDFLFYNGTIKGHTFNELTTATKLKVLSIALYFDSKIEKYFPGYKESISNTASKIYTNIKSKIVSSYLTITASICSENSDLCESAKEGFTELKTNFGLTFDLIKDIAGDGLANLKSWYEIWSGK